MSESKSNTQSVPVPIVGLLGVLFVVGLKLTGYIDWSWWWVTLPFWGAAAFVLIVAVIILGVGGVLAIAELTRSRDRKKMRGRIS